MKLTIKQKFSLLFLSNALFGLILLAVAIPTLNSIGGGFNDYLDAFAALDDSYQQRAKQYASTLEDSISGAISLLCSVIIGVLLLVSGATWFVLQSITKKIGHTVKTMHEIAEGGADLCRRLDVDGDDEIDQLSKEFNAFGSTIHSTVEQLAQASRQLKDLASESSTVSAQTSSDTLLQQQNTVQTVSAMEEMSLSIKGVAAHADDAAQVAKDAKKHAISGETEVNKAIGAISQLATGMDRAVDTAQNLANDSQQIGSVLDVIKGIAEQTNLLALNAAIEAARAGEQGRGFAVVADEVRTLASRTQQSTEEIQEMIEKLQVNTTQVVNVIEQGRDLCETSVTQSTEAGESLVKINNAVEQITDLTAAIVGAVDEQTKVSGEISQSIENVSAVSNRSAGSAQQSASSNEELENLTISLNSMVNHFRI